MWGEMELEHVLRCERFLTTLNRSSLIRLSFGSD